MQKKTNFSIWYFIFAILIIISLQGLFNRPHVENLQYSKFRNLIEQKKVKDLVITKDAITGLVAEEVVAAEKSKQSDEKTKSLSEEKTTTQSKEKAWHNFTTTRVEDSDLINALRQNGIAFKGEIESNWLFGIISWILPLVFFFGIWMLLSKRMGGGMHQNLMAIGKSNAKVYVENETRITFDDVAGIDEAEEELKEVVEYLKTPKKFQRLGGKIPKGVLLVGPPGTGKTLLAKAVAGEAGVPFFRMNGSEFVEMFVGVGAARVRDLFHQASQKAPCIIFIDELDALGKARGINPLGGHDEREQTLNQLLVEMDGFDTNRAVIIMGATNRPETLDLALLRPGRFDRQVLVDRPDVNGREAILKIHSREVTLANDVDLHIVAARTPGFVGADLANLVNEAALLAARKSHNEVTMSDFEEAIDRIVGGLEKKSRIMNSKEKEIVAFHESGHALIAELMPTADPVHKISIIPRGIAALGYTMQLPTDERYLLTRNELLDRLAVLLGGRAAEEIIFEEISTGAQNDLQRATDIARSMVKQYGMSDELGLVFLEPKRRSLFLKEDFAGEREYSEETARSVDNEVKRIITESYDKVKNILTENKVKLEKLARILLDKEVMEGEEIRQLLGIKKKEKV